MISPEPEQVGRYLGGLHACLLNYNPLLVVLQIINVCVYFPVLQLLCVASLRSTFTDYLILHFASEDRGVDSPLP